MASPIITVGSYQQLETATNPAGSFSIPISAAGSDRVVFITCTAKDNSSPAADISSIIFDSAGVNLSIGAGITEKGSRQIAQESTFSSQCSLFLIKESDLPAIAGSYVFDVLLSSGPQYGFWEAWEVTNASDILDAITEISSIIDVSGDADFSGFVTTTVVDCLVMDIISTSHSSAPTFAIRQNQLGQQSRTNGGTVISWTNKPAAGSQVMVENSSSFHQRHAGKIISIAPVAAIVALNASLNITLDDSASNLQSSLEQDSNINIVLSDTLSNIQASIEEDINISVQFGDSITSIFTSQTETVVLDLILGDTISSSSVIQINDANISLTLSNTTVNIVTSEIETVILNIILENTVSASSLKTEQKINLNNILDNTVVNINANGSLISSVILDIALQDSITGIVASETETAIIAVVLEPTISALQAQQVSNVNIGVQLQNSITNIVAGLGNTGNTTLNVILQNTVASINTGIELRTILGVKLGDSISNINISGVILTNGSFTKIVEGHEIYAKKATGKESFIKISEGSEVFTKRIAA